MSVYSCIVVDDEPLARKILQDYIQRLPSLQLAASCKNAGEAMEALHRARVDIIFCDIEMPGISGLQFISSLSYKPSVIITSAYSEYAVKGFTLGVTDYLLKPIALERFMLAVNRATDSLKPAPAVALSTAESVFFKTSNISEKVFLSNIDYIEAYGNYSRLHLADSDKKLLVNHKISELESELASKQFIRVHKSNNVNQQHVLKVSANTVFVNQTALPLGESFKQYFFDQIQTKR